ncbi:MAG: biosynthetic-type acetolactate synthase large subunit [Candidatus Methanogranum gryphiswaldense]|nr:MAG: biosynthetic-type acetolactate synthase large subunit [Candidatus Methanogranum sp. U3.2.1]
MKGSRALLKTLEDRNVETMFGYPGGVVIPIYDEILDSSIRHVLVRHEQCAAHMADAYARACGIPGVCLATSGPGATNLTTGIATAYADSSPMLAITGQVGTGSLGLGAFQEVDAYSLMMPITKHNFRVLDIDKMPNTIAEAWQICQTGRPGPVHIDIPVDQVNSQIDERLINEAEHSIKPLATDISGLQEAADWIRMANRPVLMIGGGVITGNACAEVQKLAEMTNTPIVTPMMGIGAVPSKHPLNMGPLGMHGRLSALEVFKNSDLIIAIGTKFSDRTFSAHTDPASCKVIHIDIDATEFSKHINHPSINLLCDAKIGTQMLIEALGGYTDNHAQWNAKIREAKKRCPCDFDYGCSPIVPQKVMHELNKFLDKDIIVTTDVGQNQMWAMHYLDIRRPRQFISSGSFGTMGFGLPSAIGAKAAKPESKVVTVTGDGGLLMVIQELATSVAEDLPVVICLLNNGWLGMVKQWQNLFWNSRYSETKLDADPDFVKVAEAFGARGIRVERPGEIADAFKQAFECDRTCLVEIKIDPEENITPMLPPNSQLPIIKGRCRF